MTKIEALIVLFDTVVWTMNHGALSDDDRDKLKAELRAIIESYEHEFTHEHYRKLNGVWTHSGSFDNYAVVNNCENKRKSFLVVLRGAVLSVGDKVTLLTIGQWVEIQPHEVRSGLVQENSRIMRVFVNTETELKTFLEVI